MQILGAGMSEDWIAWDKQALPEGIGQDCYIDLIANTGWEHHHYKAGPEFMTEPAASGAQEVGAYVQYYRLSRAQSASVQVRCHNLPLPAYMLAGYSYSPLDERWLNALSQALEDKEQHR